MGEQNKVVQKNCKIIRDDNIIKNKVKLTGTIDDIELDITGSIQSMKCTREYVDMSRATYHITIVEDNNLGQPEALAAEGVQKRKYNNGSPPFAKQI